MGRITDRVRGARLLASYVSSLPGIFRTIAHSDGPQAARVATRKHMDRILDRAGIEVELTGREHLPDSGYVLTYNETSVPDLLVNQGYFWDMADRGVTVPFWSRMPWFRAAAEQIGVEVLPRGRPAVDALMNRFAAEARAGRRILWGGEGGLTGIDGVRPFKTGAARIAIRAQVPLVPMAVRGGQNLLPLGGLRLRPGTMHVAIGEPLASEGLTEDDTKALTRRAQNAVEGLYAALPPT